MQVGPTLHLLLWGPEGTPSDRHGWRMYVAGSTIGQVQEPRHFLERNSREGSLLQVLRGFRLLEWREQKDNGKLVHLPGYC